MVPRIESIENVSKFLKRNRFGYAITLALGVSFFTWTVSFWPAFAGTVIADCVLKSGMDIFDTFAIAAMLSPIINLGIGIFNAVLFSKRAKRHNRQTLKTVKDFVFDTNKDLEIKPNNIVKKFVFINKKLWDGKFELKSICSKL